jgi:predicted secreted protein
MTRAATAALLVAIALVALAAPAGARPACTNTKLGAHSSGKRIVLHGACDRLTITLLQSFDGGYAWSVSHRPAGSVLKLVSARSVATEPAGTVGGSDDYVIVYRAAGAGTTSLKLVEARSFEPHRPVATFSLTVRVK